MRARILIAAAAMTAAMLGAEGVTAAPVTTIAVGPIQGPGGFSQENMHPVFPSCSFRTWSSPTATTVVTFVIRPNTHEAYFQITNSCGTYDETFRLTECVQFRPGQWSHHLMTVSFAALGTGAHLLPGPVSAFHGPRLCGNVGDERQLTSPSPRGVEGAPQHPGTENERLPY